jgi:hypothetical protein
MRFIMAAPRESHVLQVVRRLGIVRAFARRAGLTVAGDPSAEFARVLGAFLSPVLDDLRRDPRREGTWPPGGPWR